LPSVLYRLPARIGDGRAVDHQEAPRVLLGNLSPIMVIGMARVLTEDGADVIGQERHPSSIVTTAGRTRPDVVVLDISTEGSRELGARVQQVSSDTKVIFCDSREGAMEVLDPGADEPRVVVVDALEGLRTELAMSRQRHQVKE
jgi:AmiR/NasT family two-component response regulator